MPLSIANIFKQILEKFSLKNIIIAAICAIIGGMLSFFFSTDHVVNALLTRLNKAENLKSLADSLEKFDVLNELIDRRIKIAHFGLSGTLKGHGNNSHVILDTEYYTIRALKLVTILDSPAPSDVTVKLSFCDILIDKYVVSKGTTVYTFRLEADLLNNKIKEFAGKCQQDDYCKSCYECQYVKSSQESFLRISSSMDGMAFSDCQTTYALYVYPKHIIKE